MMPHAKHIIEVAAVSCQALGRDRAEDVVEEAIVIE